MDRKKGRRGAGGGEDGRVKRPGLRSERRERSHRGGGEREGVASFFFPFNC